MDQIALLELALNPAQMKAQQVRSLELQLFAAQAEMIALSQKIARCLFGGTGHADHQCGAHSRA